MPLDNIFNSENNIFTPPELQNPTQPIQYASPYDEEDEQDELSQRPGVLGQVWNAAKAFVREGAVGIPVGFLDTVSVGAKKLEEWFGTRGWSTNGEAREYDEMFTYNLARLIQGYGEQYLGSDPELAESFLANVLPGALGQGAAYIAGGAASGARFGFAAVAGGTQAAAVGYHEAISRGATEEQATQRFLAGAGLGTTQGIPIMRFFQRAERAGGGVIKRALLEAAQQGAEEGVQEFLQTVGENIATFIIYDEDQGFWDDIVPAATTGMSAGAILGFTASAIMGRRLQANIQQRTQQVQDVASRTEGDGQASIEPHIEPSEPGGPVVARVDGVEPEVINQHDATRHQRYLDPNAGLDPALRANLDPQQEVSPDAESHIAENISNMDLDDVATIDYLQKFGLSKEHVKHLRRSLNLDELPAPQRRSWTQAIIRAAITRADRKIDHGIAGLMSNPRPISDVEYAGLLIRSADVMLNREQTVAAQYHAQQEGNFAEAKRLGQDVNAFDGVLDTYTKVSDMTGSEIGRAMAIRKLQIAPERFSLNSILQDAAIAKQSPLTEAETAMFTEQHAKMQAVEGKIADLEQNFEAKLEEFYAKQAQAEIAKQAAVKGKKESTAAERERLKKELQQLGLRLNDLTGVSAEGVYKLGQYALTFARDGVTDLGQIVNRMQQQLPSLSARDVYTAITAQNPKSKAQARKQTKTHIRRLKKQADILLELDDALVGVFRGKKAKPGTQVKHDELIKAARKKITELRKEAFSSQIESERLGRIMDKITHLEKELGIRVAVDPNIESAKQTLSDLRTLLRTNEQIADLQNQMQTGNFKSAWKPPRQPVLPALEQARLEKEILQRQIKARVAYMEPFHLRDFLRTQGPWEAFKSTVKKQAPQYVQLPRTLLATADMSYALRQGLLLSVRNPIRAARIFGTAARSMRNKDFAIAVDMAMRADPNHMMREMAGLYLAPVEGGRITDVEEAFASRIAHNIPGFGRIIRASERNMTVGLNLLRAAAFDQFVAKHDGQLSQETMQAYANYVNAASGRGKMDGKVAAAASYAFFAPRFAYSRFTAPAHMVKYWGMPEVRKEMAKDWITLGLGGSLFLALAQAAGAIVGMDPRDSDFGRIVIGNTRIDIWGSFQGPMRLIMNIGMSAADERGMWQEFVGSSGMPRDMFGLTSQFLTYKLSPAVTIPADLMRGKNIIGQEVTWNETLARSIFPLMVQEVWDGWHNEGVLGAALGATEMVGLSSNARDNPLHRGPTKRLLNRADYRPSFGRYPEGIERSLRNEMKKTFEEQVAYDIELRFGYLNNLNGEQAKEMLQDIRAEARRRTLDMYGHAPPRQLPSTPKMAGSIF